MHWYHSMFFGLALAAGTAAASLFAEVPQKPLTAGVIGLDTSHAPPLPRPLPIPRRKIFGRRAAGRGISGRQFRPAFQPGPSGGLYGGRGERWASRSSAGSTSLNR